MNIDYSLLRLSVSARRRTQLLEMARRMRCKGTPAEDYLWRWLRCDQRHGFRFRRQHVLGPFIADFFCQAALLVIEVDGPIHQTRSNHDAERDHLLNEAGLLVLRFSNEDVLTRTPHVIQRIDTLLLGSAPQPGPPPQACPPDPDSPPP